MAILGDVLRVLPTIVLGVLQGQRLRHQIQLEREAEEFERFKREFEKWQMARERQAVEEASRMQTAFLSGLSRLLEDEERPPTQPTATVQPSMTPQPIQMPTLTVPPSLRIRPSRRKETIVPPPPSLQLPTPIQPTPPTVPAIDYDSELNDALRKLEKYTQAHSYVRAYGSFPALQPTATITIPAIEGNIRNTLSRIRGLIADKLVKSGVAKDMGEVRQNPQFWDDYIAILENYRDVPIIQQEIQYAQGERERAHRIQQRKEDLNWRREENRLRLFARLPLLTEAIWRGYEQKADRLLRLVAQVEQNLSRLIEAGLGRTTLTTNDLRFIEQIVNLAGPALVAFGKDKAQVVLKSTETLINALIEGRREARQIAEQLTSRFAELRDLLWKKLFAAEYMANQMAGATMRLVEGLTAEALEVDPATVSRFLGMPTADITRSFMDFKNALDNIPEEAEGITPPTPLELPTLQAPPPPSEQLPRRAEPTATPSPPTPTVPTPPTTPQPTPAEARIEEALRTLVFGAVAQRATEEQLQQIERELRIEGQRYLNQIRRVQAQFTPVLTQLRAVSMQAGIDRARAELQRTLQEMAFPPQVRTVFNNLTSRIGTLVMSLRKRDPATRQLKYLTGDEAASLMFEGITAVLNAFQGNRQPLQNFVGKLKNYEVVSRNLPEDVSAFLSQLLLGTPFGTPTQPQQQQQPQRQQPQQPQQQQPQRQQSQKKSLYPLSPEEEDIGELLGGM